VYRSGRRAGEVQLEVCNANPAEASKPFGTCGVSVIGAGMTNLAATRRSEEVQQFMAGYSGTGILPPCRRAQTRASEASLRAPPISAIACHEMITPPLTPQPSASILASIRTEGLKIEGFAGSYRSRRLLSNGRDSLLREEW
jgi:hypothetical protein